MRFSSDVAFAPSHLTTHGKAVVFPAWIAEELACSAEHRAKSVRQTMMPLKNAVAQAGWRIGRLSLSGTGHSMMIINWTSRLVAGHHRHHVVE